MPSSRLRLFQESFARRTLATAAVDLSTVDRPGLCGSYGTAEHPAGRLLITDDRAATLLEALMPTLYPRVINVFQAAVHCTDLVRAVRRWRAEPATAMICHDLSGVPAPPTLPAGLSLRPVHRLPSDPGDGVPLEDAAHACLAADPSMADVPLPGFLDYLRSIPPTTQLWAAIDTHGVVRATAGCSVIDTDANAFFVNTDPQWRHRGIATAMTASALHSAHTMGAKTATLDASPAGLSIYLHLGFEPISPTTLFTPLID